MNKLTRKEENECMDECRRQKQARASENEPRTPVIVTLKACVNLPSRWIKKHPDGEVTLKDDLYDGDDNWWFIGLTLRDDVHFYKEADFGLIDYMDTDEPIMEIDEEC